MASALNDVLWQRISEELAQRNLHFRDLWSKLDRDKNTFTNWKHKKTIPQISDLEELAYALGVHPAELLRPNRGGEKLQSMPEQLALQFEPGSKNARIEVECTPGGLLLRFPRKSA